MKTHWLLTFSFALLLVSCGNDYISITIANKLNEPVHNLSVYVQGKEFEVERINAGNNATIRVKISEMTTNTHDFRIESAFKMKDGRMNTGFYYSDLSGSPNSEYTMEILNATTIIK